MKRILLLAFIHGFRGSDFTFGDFPDHLKDTAANNLPDHEVATAVYPRYETRGELAESTAAFREWLKERVMELRKTHLQDPWPPNDRRVGVVLVAHSMGGFVASDCLFRVLDDHRESGSTGPIFPLIQGVLAFDTPLNGLARSMFVYGAFSNYNKVSNVFNIMTAISAATPAALSRLASKRALSTATGRIAKRTTTSSPAWKAWQLIAMRTGTVGVIAAGGVAAYTHRRRILEGVRSVRGLTRDDIVQGYQQSVDALGQGLAYVNRGSVGESFAWLSDHFTFVGALLKQNELTRRLERLAALRGGVGVCVVYASLGENGYWSGGYFVPERTFCAIPARDEPEAGLFARHVVEGAADEIAAHIGMFKKERNKEYETMVNDLARRIVDWFNDEAEIYDDPKFAGPPPAEAEETEAIAKAVDSEGVAQTEKDLAREAEEGARLEGDTEMGVDDDVPDESPIDIAAAAALVPLPDDIEHDLEDSAAEGGKTDQKKAYLQHLFGVAQSTGTSLRSYLPLKLPVVDMPKVSMPAVGLPNMPAMPNMPNVSLPARINPFSKKPAGEETSSEKQDGEGENSPKEQVGVGEEKAST
ncbi:hypothetical protein N658DRAFT_478795 [Parathielavia hyrcaniae]|uniref:DUF676 domain-containing protein n=1 Tax=Parathielavia hyrcaniae TaxID=113614 RepID=A0AAN6PVL3_9PEZI|nr:hypothetical protein N658DRAFT_478795 [Parathielavia hyrcaniae]